MKSNSAFLICTVKDEGPYLLEWIAWHRLLGFDKILVAQNDSEDGTLELLECLAENNLIQFFENSGLEQDGSVPRSYQERAYRKMFSSISGGNPGSWTMALDADEFLVVRHAGGTVKDLIRRVDGEFDEVRVNWRPMSAQGIQRFEDEPLTTRFTKGISLSYYQTGETCIKTIFRTDSAVRVGAHSPTGAMGAKRRIANGSGLLINPPQRAVTQNDPSLCSLAYVAHFRTRDVDSFLIKKRRGNVDSNYVSYDMQYWRKSNPEWVVEVEDLRSMGAPLRAEINLLCELTGGRAAELHKRAVRIHQSWLHELEGRQEFMELATQIDSTYTRYSLRNKLS